MTPLQRFQQQTKFDATLQIHKSKSLLLPIYGATKNWTTNQEQRTASAAAAAVNSILFDWIRFRVELDLVVYCDQGSYRCNIVTALFDDSYGWIHPLIAHRKAEPYWKTSDGERRGWFMVQIFERNALFTEVQAVPEGRSGMSKANDSGGNDFIKSW